MLEKIFHYLIKRAKNNVTISNFIDFNKLKNVKPELEFNSENCLPSMEKPTSLI